MSSVDSMRKSVKYNLSQRKKKGFLGLSKTQLKYKIRNKGFPKKLGYNKRGREMTQQRKQVLFRKGMILTGIFFIGIALAVWCSIWMFG